MWYSVRKCLTAILACVYFGCAGPSSARQTQSWPITLTYGSSCTISYKFDQPKPIQGVCRAIVEVRDSCKAGSNSTRFIAIPPSASFDACLTQSPLTDFFSESAFYADYDNIQMLRSVKRHLESFTWSEAKASGIIKKHFDALKLNKMSLLIGFRFHKFDKRTQEDFYQASFGMPGTQDSVVLIIRENGARVEWRWLIVD